ncbi:MAG: spore maturation protein [Firmicutes bacterium]|nr:spore maturation protein [Bacillota bacterium]
MMNKIWGFIFISAFVFSLCTGNLQTLNDAMINSSGSAVQFILGLAGIMAMWSGLMEIAEKTGLINSLSKLLLPFTKLLFPQQHDSEILSSIIMSFMANLFGAGNSSTVFALRTMEKLDVQNKHRPRASNDMCTFAVVNMAIAPLFPVVIVQIRQLLGSGDPYSIVVPSIITAAVTILVSLVACRILERSS